MPFATTEYLSIGGNRYSAAADWAIDSGEFAFGADQYVAIWQPLHPLQKGISALLKGHTDKVTAVRCVRGNDASKNEAVVSGSANGELCLWERRTSEDDWSLSARCKAHDGAVNSIAGTEGPGFVATGGAEATVKLWKYDAQRLLLLHSIKLIPRYIPLTLVLGTFRDSSPGENALIAVGGTRSVIQIFALTQLNDKPQHELQASLAGHEGWIRSLSMREDTNGGLLLASASHDKYIRLWGLSSVGISPKSKSTQPDDLSLFGQTLTAKVQTVSVPGSNFAITFEALLLCHEDWIYSAAWNPKLDVLQLLTASADGSLIIWEPDPSSGIWVSTSRLGEISGQKGATTATGSAGGFWTGVWSPDGQAVTCLGRTGSWRLWEYDSSLRYWVQKPGVSGHVASASGISWSPCGSYLLSTSSDQTTKLHAEWRREDQRTWHEFARPQIHGYDLNCVISVSSSSFVSGADEKLLRVFDEPKAVARMLKRLCQVHLPNQDSLPDIASMPVLGLSNKAVDDSEDTGAAENGEMSDDRAISHALDLNEPPTEDVLARHTLWPEHEKLYGHGYEISAASANKNQGVLATACKASSLEHAVIRLYDTKDWHEIKPALSSHSLTVTNLVFSNTAEPYLLSVGRDRQWTIFAQDEAGGWKLCQSNPKAHSRMVLDCAWSAEGDRPFFATAGRDKMVKIWKKTAEEKKADFVLAATLKHDSPVVALSFTTDKDRRQTFLAAGEEDGMISLYMLQASGAVEVLKSVQLEGHLCLSKAVTRLEWRPDGDRYITDGQGTQLAVAGADGSVRILRVDLRRICDIN